MAKKNPFAKFLKPGSAAEEKAEGPKVEAAEERAYQKSLKAKSKPKAKKKK